MVNHDLDSEVHKQGGETIQEMPWVVRDNIDALTMEIGIGGPVRGNWPNYSKLSDTDMSRKANRRMSRYGVRIKDRSDLWK